MDNTTEPTGMETMTNAELKALCAEAGLPTYGNKEQLIERLQMSAAAELAEPSEPVASAVEPEPTPEPAPAPEPVKPAMPAVIIQSTAAPGTLPPINHAAHVQEVLDTVRDRFPGVALRYDSNEEVFIIEGGRQGRLTTTARQPMRPILLAIEGYWNMARGRAKVDIGELI
jgi:hypothetical protein